MKIFSSLLRAATVAMARCVCASLLLSAFIFSPPARADDQEVLEILAVNWPPYEFEKPEGDFKGFDVEVVEEIFRRMNKPAGVVFRPWARAKKMVFEGGGFALLTCGMRKDRDAYLHYSDAISQGTWGYFYRRDHTGSLPQNVEELRGHTIAVVRDYNQHKQLKELGIESHPVNSDALAVTVVAKRRVEFAYVPKESAEYAAKDLGLNREIAYHPFGHKSYHLCVSRKWPNAQEIILKFNEGLAQLMADGTFAAIHTKYGSDHIGS